MTSRPVILRNSESKDLRRCPWRWWHVWRMGLRPLGSISDALWFGTGVHLALAAWYCGPGGKRGPEPAETFERWAQGEFRFIKTSNKYGDGAASMILEKLEPAMELGIVLLEAYRTEWDTDENWSVIAPEQSFQVDIMDPDDALRLLLIFAGTYDLVVRDRSTGKIWLIEHKTAKAIQLDHLPLDSQAGSYWMVAGPHLRHAGLIGPKEKLEGIMYNFIRKSLPDTRPVNLDGFVCNKPVKQDYIDAINKALAAQPWSGPKDWDPEKAVKNTLLTLEDITNKLEIPVWGEPSKLQPKPLFERFPVRRSAHEQSKQLRQIQNVGIQMEQFRNGQPLYKNPTRDCQWDCPVYGLCMLDEQGGDVAEYQKAMFRVEDPYKDHRKSTEE